MSQKFPYFLTAEGGEADRLRRNWFWFLGLGVVLMLLGFAALGYPIAATLATVEIVGVFLLFAGAVQLGSAVFGRGWNGFFPQLLSALLWLFLGAVFVERPGLGAAGYTLMLAVFFLASGLFRIAAALTRNFSGWGWTLFSGGVSVLLGLFIWRDFPESALWVIGTFIGIELAVNGFSWVMLGLGARTIPAGAEIDRMVRA